MQRRDLLRFVGAAGAAVAFPRIVFAQQAAKVPRIAFVWPLGLEPQTVDAYRRGLTDYGYLDGKTITLEEFAAPTLGDLPALLLKVVATKPDLILVHGGPAAVAAKAATNSIPVVFGSASDPDREHECRP